MKIRYQGIENFSWTKESAKKEILKFLLDDYTSTDYEAENNHKLLNPQLVEEKNKKDNTRKFGRKTYTDILDSGLKSIMKSSLDDLSKVLQLKPDMLKIINQIDSSMTIKEILKPKNKSIILGATGNITSMSDELEKGLDKKIVNKILNQIDVETVNFTKDKNTKISRKTWKLDENSETLNLNGEEKTLQEHKIDRIKEIGYSQINVTQSDVTLQKPRRKIVRRTKGKKGLSTTLSFKPMEERTLEPNVNPLDWATKDKSIDDSTEKKWNETEAEQRFQGLLDVTKGKKISNYEILQASKLRVKISEEITTVLEDLEEYEYEEGDTLTPYEADKKYSDKKTVGVYERGIPNETIIDEINVKGTGKLELKYFNDATMQSIKFLNKNIFAMAEETKKQFSLYFKILEVLDKIEEFKEEKEEFEVDSPFIKKLIVLLQKLDVDFSASTFKTKAKLKSPKLFDSITKKINVKLRKAERAYVKQIVEMKKQIRREKISADKIVTLLNKSKRDAIKAAQKKIGGKKPKIQTSDKAEEIYDDVEKFAKGYFFEAIQNLKAVSSMTIQVDKIIKEDKEPRFKLVTLQSAKIKGITVTKAISGNYQAPTRISKPLDPKAKRKLSFFLARLERRYKRILTLVQ